MEMLNHHTSNGSSSILEWLQRTRLRTSGVFWTQFLSTCAWTHTWRDLSGPAPPPSLCVPTALLKATAGTITVDYSCPQDGDHKAFSGIKLVTSHPDCGCSERRKLGRSFGLCLIIPTSEPIFSARCPRTTSRGPSLIAFITFKRERGEEKERERKREREISVNGPKARFRVFHLTT